MTAGTVRWFLAAALGGLLVTERVARYEPPLPDPLELEFLLAPATRINQSEPIVTAGVAGRADFLYLHRALAGQIFIGYDSWNSDRARSEEIPMEAGTRHRLSIEMPSLTAAHGHFTNEPQGLVRVRLDGQTVLAARVHFYPRTNEAIYIGTNPAGGTSVDPEFRGQIFDEEGREKRGGPRGFFSWGARLRSWLQVEWAQALSLLVGVLVLGRWGTTPSLQAARDVGRATLAALVRHRGFSMSVTFCAAIFAWFVTMGSFDFSFPESFGDFYDFQARSLLRGRLDVPETCLAGEAFTIDGKTYGYFGITPALLRLPLAIFDGGIGRLSRWFMLVDYVAALVAAYLIFLTARRVVLGTTRTPSTWVAGLFVLNAGLGSTFLFLGSRSYIYHEAIMCGAALTLFAVWGALRYAATGSPRWWLSAFVCGLLAVHARPPLGLFALSLLGAVALHTAWQRRRYAPALLAALSAAGLLSFNALSYLKFKTFDGQPLRYNASYTPERLARFKEQKFHLENIPFVAVSYLADPALTWRREFPWIYSAPSQAWVRPAKTMDMTEPTVGFPFTMPALCLLATLGVAGAWRRQKDTRVPLALLGLAVLPMTLLLFAAIAISHRYTADFVPFLISAAAFGLAALEGVAGRWRQLGLILLTVATVGAMVVTSALTLHQQRAQIWGVPENVRTDYQAMQRRVDRFFLNTPPQK